MCTLGMPTGLAQYNGQNNGQVVSIPNPALLPGDAGPRLHELVAKRRAFFQAQRYQEEPRQYDYFHAVNLWQERRPELVQLQRQRVAANTMARRAAGNLERAKKLAFGHAGRGMVAAVAAAEADLQAAQATFGAIQARENEFRRVRIDPLAGYLKRVGPQWAGLYAQMAELVPRVATDPGVNMLANAWENAGAGDKNFVEAHVLGAVANIYAGKLAAAEVGLKEASACIRELKLLELPVAIDCCHGWLLLGKPMMCKEFVEYLESLPDTATVIGQDWAIGLHAYAERKLNGGAAYFSRAVGDAIKLREKFAEEAPPAMWGDAVVSLLQTDEVNANRGRNFFKKAGPKVVGDGSWQVLRARSMIAVEAENDATNWHEAVALLVACKERAPGPMQAELVAQLDAYRQQRIWNVRDWKPAAVAGVPVAPVHVPQPPPPPLPEGDSDPRYAYDGRFPKSNFRIRFDAIRTQTDIASVMRWREMLRALFDSGLTLDEIDWAEHQIDGKVDERSFDADEAVRFQKYVTFTVDGW